MKAYGEYRYDKEIVAYSYRQTALVRTAWFESYPCCDDTSH